MLLKRFRDLGFMVLGVRVGDKFSVQSLAFGGWDLKFRVEAWGAFA